MVNAQWHGNRGWSHIGHNMQMFSLSFSPLGLILYVRKVQKKTSPPVLMWQPLHPASPLTHLRCYRARPISLFCWNLWPPRPHPRLKCLNTSPLHVLVVKVRWVHGLKKRDLKKKITQKKAADNSFPVSESVFHLTFSNKKEPFPMSFLKYARKKKKLARLS